MKEFQEINKNKILELKNKNNKQIHKEVKATPKSIEKCRKNVELYPDNILVLQLFYNYDSCMPYQKLINEMISEYLPKDEELSDEELSDEE